MAIVPNKLSLRRKTETPSDVNEEPVAPKRTLAAAPAAQAQAAAPAKRVLLKKPLAAAPVEPEPEVEPEGEVAPEVETVVEEVVEETPAPAPVRKLAAKPAAAKPIVKQAQVKPAALADEEEDAEAGADPVERGLVAYSPMSMGTIDGDITERDIMRPRITMVQANSSDLEEKGFTVGQIALNGEILIWEKDLDPLKMILLTGRKKFIQKLTDEEYKNGDMPMIFDNPVDAQAAGFTTEWVDNEPPTVDPGLFCLFLLEQPDYIEPDPIFSLEYGDRRFALAEMRFTGVNYRSSTAGRWLMTQSRTSLVPDSRHFMLGMTCSRDKQKSGNIVTVANFRNLGRHKDVKFIDWVMSLG